MSTLPIFKAAAVQMCSCGSVQDNLTFASNAIQKATAQGAKLIVLPEMFPTLAVENGHIAAREPFGAGPIQNFLSTEAKKHSVWIVGGTIPITSAENDRIYAACLTFNDQGECVGRYDKIHLFDAKIDAGKEEYQESKKTLAGSQPFVLDTPFGKLGFAVCYDVRFPELFTELNRLGAEIFILPSAFISTTGKAHWEILCRARAIEHLCYLIGANQTGTHCNGRCSFGHSMIVDPWGTILAEEKEQTGMAIAEIDLNKLHAMREKLPLNEHRRLG